MTPALRVALAILAVVVIGACRPEQISESKRVVYLDGQAREDVGETLRINADGGRIVQRFHSLHDKHGGFEKDVVMSLDRLDKDGFAIGASFRREGPRGKRYVELRRWDKGGEDDGKLVLFSRGNDETLVLPEKPVVVLDALHFLKARNVDVTLVDVENATFVAAHVDANGAISPGPRTVEVAADAKPTATAASPAPTTPLAATDPVQPRHKLRAPFLESTAPKVVKWCKQQAATADEPLKAARSVALAVKPKLSLDKAGGPPSALSAVEYGGFDQSGAALTVACARALGFSARVVTGVVDGAARSWAQVHDGTSWVDVDPLDIDVDGVMKLPHAAQLEGFPTSL